MKRVVPLMSLLVALVTASLDVETNAPQIKNSRAAASLVGADEVGHRDLEPIASTYVNSFYYSIGGTPSNRRCPLNSEIRARSAAGDENVDLSGTICIVGDAEEKGQPYCTQKTGAGERKQGYDFSRAMVRILVAGARDLLSSRASSSSGNASPPSPRRLLQAPRPQCLDIEPDYDAFYINEIVELPTTLLKSCNITAKSALRPADGAGNHGQLIRTRFEITACFIIAYSHGRTICKSYFSQNSDRVGAIPSRAKLYSAYVEALELGLQSHPDCR